MERKTVNSPAPVSLRELTLRISSAITAARGLNDVWVVAETSDLRLSGGHCYMELVQKDDGGVVLAKARAVAWANTYARIAAKFAAETGARLQSDIKIMVRVNANYHPVYGFSLVITDIDPGYTVGDLARKRNRILAQLQAEGVLELNKSLPLSPTPMRIAIISAQTAAGYGDFINHLYSNPRRLRFSTKLFPAMMQGEKTSPSIITALEKIMGQIDDFDCVVIIRGGGAVSDLASFDDYELASNVAQFPLPVIVGIGHERDVTVLDYVAAVRVKTPTAAAEFLVSVMLEALERLCVVGGAILDAVSSKIEGQRRQLAYYHGNLPAYIRNIIARQHIFLGRQTAEEISASAKRIIGRRREQLNAVGIFLDAVSPLATLRRGYSITRVNGHAITDADSVASGTLISTTLASGTIESVSK